MVHHIVMWKLKEEAEGRTKHENALWIKAQLEALLGEIPGMRSAKVHLNENADPKCYDAVLEADYESWEALAAYRVHPKHKAVSGYVALVREARGAVDYELPD